MKSWYSFPKALEEMGNIVEASLKNLFFSIENKDMQLAERIVADDRNVNNLERSIEAQCLMLIHNPAAHLHRISARFLLF